MLQRALVELRAAFPDGLPESDYFPLLAVLADYFSEVNLGRVVAELVDGEIVVVRNDVAAVQGFRRPRPEVVAAMRDHLTSAGFQFDAY